MRVNKKGTEKVCRICFILLNPENQSSYASGKRDWICKKCKTEETRKYYSEHQEKLKKFMRHKARKRQILTKECRKKILEFLGSKCVVCGFSDKRALCIDHVNSDGYLERRKFRGLEYYSHILRELEKGSKAYQLLCANHNMIKASEKREYPFYEKK